MSLTHFFRKSAGPGFDILVLICCLTTSTDEEEDDDIVELSAGEVAWQKCLDLIPNCFGKANITVESPPLDLLPFRSWPKKSSYTININKIGSSSRCL